MLRWSGLLLGVVSGERSIMEYDAKARGRLCIWRLRIERAKEFHYRREHRLECLNKTLSIFVILFSGASSALSFWSLGNASKCIGFLGGVFGAFAAALAAIQLLGNFKNEALENHNSAKEYNALEAEIEHAISVPWKPADEFMADFRSKWRDVDEHAPYIPPSYYKKKCA
jgi:hypothetical protein